MRVKRDDIKDFNSTGGYREIIYERVHDPNRMTRVQVDEQCRRLNMTDTRGRKPLHTMAPTEVAEDRTPAISTEAEEEQPNNQVQCTNRRVKKTDAARFFESLEWFMGPQP